MLVGVIAGYNYQSKPQLPSLPVALSIQSPAITPVDYQLQHFAIDANGQAYGVSGKKLLRIDTVNDSVQEVFAFKSSIVGFHISVDNRFVISTDNNHLDESAPCHLFESDNQGKDFKLIKEIIGGCAIYWSLSSDQNYLYVGEYGPKKPQISKYVWRRDNKTDQWDIIFKAKLTSKAHIHRVAVDHSSGNLWVTTGDTRKNRGIYVSGDQGETWVHKIDSQATAVAFVKHNIYWGEDSSKYAGVFMSDINGEDVERVFTASDYGNYQGSIYKLLELPDDSVLAPIMKYPDGTNVAALWRGKQKQWQLLMILESLPGQGVDVSSIAGPDKNGYILLSGFKIDYSLLEKLD